MSARLRRALAGLWSLPRAVAHVEQHLDMVHGSLQRQIARAAQPPPPFVMVQVHATANADSEEPRPLLWGASLHLNRRHVFSFDTLWAVHDVRVLVLCDVERVRVSNVLAGSLVLGSVAAMDRELSAVVHWRGPWNPGVHLGIECELRQ